MDLLFDLNSVWYWGPCPEVLFNSWLHEQYFTVLALVPTLVVLRHSDYWKERSEKDTGQVTNNPNIVAARCIDRVKSGGSPVSFHDVNQVLSVALAAEGLSVTEAELEELKAIPCTSFFFPLIGECLSTFSLLVPSRYLPGQGVWGVYMYLNKVTNELYVGSSRVCGERLRHYWKNHGQGSLRTVLGNIREYGLSNFRLQLYIIPTQAAAAEARLLLALEQYYILSMDPALNDILVAGGSPGGQAVAAINRQKNSKPIYMYLDNVLIHIFPASGYTQFGIVTLLNTSPQAVRTSLRTGKLYMDTFVLSQTPLHTLPLKHELLSLETVRSMVDAARASYLSRLHQKKPTKHNKQQPPLFFAIWFLLETTRSLWSYRLG